MTPIGSTGATAWITSLAFAVSAGCAVQAPSPQQRMAKIGSALTVGTQEDVAVRLLRGQGFHCRELARSAWTDANPSVVRTLFCPANTETALGGFSVTYVNLGIDASRRLATISSGAYGSGAVPAERR